ncbi:MAG: hypothetical protein EXX96DRAFT_53107 [Benjaminiella poitrasii]|nr:MAG: hypothetical protein EXX96DRAFT_53107 [Benjaminiella poitrasii]
MTLANKNLLEGDKTKRKRLKVVSACGECRRKKTKCNGEKPCVGCIKARVECKYINNNNSLKQPPAALSIHHHHLQQQQQQQSTMSRKPSSVSSIELIEKRLGVIENVLRSLINISGNNSALLPELMTASPNNSRPATTAPSDNTSSSPSPLIHLIHAPHAQNKLKTREKRQRHEGGTVDDFFHHRNNHEYHESQNCYSFQNIANRLVPIKIRHTSTIKNLLNSDDEQDDYNNVKKRKYPWHTFNDESPHLPAIQSSPPPSGITRTLDNNNNSSAFYRIPSFSSSTTDT